tara:strand:+ start:1292 stop:1456 length:165 start_codon:yes stop_codon:yes gene_type:complete
MELSLLIQNIFAPTVLFFFIGVIAVFCKSDLEIPAPLPKLFSPTYSSPSGLKEV